MCMCECCFQRVSACHHPSVRACVHACLSLLCSCECVSICVRNSLRVFLFASLNTVSVFFLEFLRVISVCACVCVCGLASFYCVIELVFVYCSASFSVSF